MVIVTNSMTYDFLVLLKKNLIIGSILINGEIDFNLLSDLKYYTETNQSVIIESFHLSQNEFFESVVINITPNCLNLTFKTGFDDRYFSNSIKYFGRDTFTRYSNSNNFPGETESKSFHLYEDSLQADVTVRRSSYYGNVVDVRIPYNKDLKCHYYKLKLNDLLKHYEALCLSYDEFKIREQHRPALLIKYKLLEIFELLKNRENLHKLRPFLNHTEPSVRRISAWHLLVLDEKQSLIILETIADGFDYNGDQARQILTDWYNQESEIQF